MGKKLYKFIDTHTKYVIYGKDITHQKRTIMLSISPKKSQQQTHFDNITTSSSSIFTDLPSQKPVPFKIIFSCLIGNMLEFYEFAMFGYLTVVLSNLFFPSTDSFFSLMLTYVAFACGFFMRPLGAIIAGYIGDTYGRKRALLFSLTLMAAPTITIGLLPTYSQIGLTAPLLLILCRLIQGISMGGEFTGSIIFLIENAPQHKQGYYSSWADLGGSLGMILASLSMIALNFFLPATQVQSWGWRLPFLSAIFLGLVGFLVRKNLTETTEFKSLPEEKRQKNPLKEIIQHNLKRLILCFLFLSIHSIGYYFLIIYIPGQNIIHLPLLTISLMTLCSLVANIPGYFIAAYLSDKWGQIQCIMIGCIGCFILAYPTAAIAGHGEIWEQLCLQMAFSFCLGICFGPRSALMTRIFPVNIRYSGVSFGYNMSNALLGGTAPLVCAYLSHQTGSITAAAFYVMLAAAISMGALVMIYRLPEKS